MEDGRVASKVVGVSAAERLSVIVVSRDRFSTTEGCLEAILAHTPEPHDLVVIIGGAPKRVERELVERFGSKAKFIFVPQFLNPAQTRNVGLRAARTRLAMLMDNDVYVRPGWLAPLIRCQQETHAAMVVPIVLEFGKRIHTAGNNLIKEKGRTEGHDENP